MEHLLRIDAQDWVAYVYLFSLATVIVLELLSPKRANTESITLRWVNNLLAGYSNGYLVRLLFPLGFINLAIYLEEWNIGLLNALSLPLLIEVLLGVIILDFAGYGLHRTMHSVQNLWRFHLIHHTDPDVNFTTAIRHHPVEAIISHLFYFLLFCALGFSPTTAICYGLLIASTPFFQHANIHIPHELDAYLRKVIVTPDVHRIHHSDDQVETDSNFGQIFTWWDHLLGTYRSAPKLGHINMKLGIEGYSGTSDQYIHKLWWLPFTYKNRPNTQTLPSEHSPEQR